MIVWNSRHLTRLEDKVLAIHPLTRRDDSPDISSDASQAENSDYRQKYWATTLQIKCQPSVHQNSQSADSQNEESSLLLDSDDADDLVPQEHEQPLPNPRSLSHLKWIQSILMTFLFFLLHWSGLGNADVSKFNTTINSGQKQKATPHIAANSQRATERTSTSFQMQRRNRLRTRVSQYCSPRQTVNKKRLQHTTKVNRTLLDVGDWRQGGNERVELINGCGVFLWKKQLIYINNHHDNDPGKLARGLLHGTVPRNLLKKMTVFGIGKDRIPLPSPILDGILKFINKEIPDKNFTFEKLKVVLNNHFKTLRV